MGSCLRVLQCSISELWNKNIILKFLIENFQIKFFKIHLLTVVIWSFSRSSNAGLAEAFEMLNKWTFCPFRTAAKLPAQWSNRFWKKNTFLKFSSKLHNCIFFDSFHTLLILIGIFYTNILLSSAILVIAI